ncbi:MAG: hypothetical protein HY885_01650 [Deltaproteobacteria bacterium]|nr:hypothetical protein [Deltaproteobacteria bacterium]
MPIHYFPLTIASTKKSIRLADSISRLRVDSARVRKLIGIREVTLSGTGLVSSISYKKNAAWNTWCIYLRGNLLSHNIRIQQTNFVLATSTQDDAILVSFAIKLMTGTLSGPYIGFSEDQNSIQFLHFRPYWGGHFLKLEQSEINCLRKLLAALLKFKEKAILTTIIELYRYAESADVSSRSLRFLQLAIILEMLFLPSQQAELSYRFQLRVAKWFNRFYKDDVRVIADKAKSIYDMRSKIAHHGQARISDNDMNCVRDFTRRALRKYVVDPSTFSDSYLNDLCLLR